MENIIISIIQTMSFSPTSVISITTYADVKNTLRRLREERRNYYMEFYNDYDTFKQLPNHQQEQIKENLRNMKTEILSTESYLRLFQDDSDDED